MKVFLYDSTFEGLLTAVYDAYYEGKPDRIYSEKSYEFNLIDEVVNIKTDITKFEKVYNAIEKKISKQSLGRIYYVYLSQLKESSNYIYYYLLMGFKYGKDVELYKHNDIVLNLDKISKKVYYEKERFLGFIRFKEVNNILYAKINPDFNILPLIGGHFKNRLTNEYFIIYDSSRDEALIYDKNNYFITTLSQKQKDVLNNSSDNENYADLWKKYFESVNIKERKNPKLQKRMMPKRYWENILEMKDSK